MATTQIASGQITITDLNDGRSFILRITDNLNSGGYFSYNPDNGSYEPNILNAGITLNATLYSTSSVTNLLTATDSTAVDRVYVRNKKWTRGSNTTSLGNSPSLVLSKDDVNSKIFADGVNTVTYTFSCEVKEDVFEVWVPFSATFTFNRVKQGAGANYILLNATPSDTFVNAADNDQIVIDAKIFQNGSLLTAPINSEAHKWFYYDDTTGGFEQISQLGLDTPATWNSLSLKSKEIYGSEVFKYTTLFPGSSTPIESSIIIIDYTDPIMIKVVTTGGDVFKPGMGNKTLTAEVYKKEGDRHVVLTSEEATALYNFTWKVYDKNGVVQNTTLPGTQSVTITQAMVNTAATFIVSVEEKPASVQSLRMMNEQYGFRNYLIK